MEVNSWAIVFATLLGPFLAVEAQRRILKRTDKKQRQLWLFRTLMNTRAGNLSIDHVNALNAIPLDFHDEETIMLKWRAYLAHLNTQADAQGVWGVRRVDLYSDLLAEMAKRLGYPFELLQLKNDFYAPQGHYEVETDQQVIRRGVAALMRGEFALPLAVKSIAQDPEMSGRIAALQERLLAWLDGKTAPKVKVEGEEKPKPRGAFEQAGR